MKAIYHRPMSLPCISADEEIRSLANGDEDKPLEPESRRKIIDKWRSMPRKNW